MNWEWTSSRSDFLVKDSLRKLQGPENSREFQPNSSFLFPSFLFQAPFIVL